MKILEVDLDRLAMIITGLEHYKRSLNKQENKARKAAVSKFIKQLNSEYDKEED